MLAPALADYPDIVHLARQTRWTVSDQNKRPIDMRRLMTEQFVIGAKHPDERCLLTLDEVLTALPNASNTTFYLKAVIDRICVVDIEPGCDPQLRQSLLALPHLYAEKSMSGKGYHLICPLPAGFSSQTPRRLRHDSGDFEILFEHWVTFTHNTIDVPQSKQPTSLDTIYDELMETHMQRQVAKRHVDISLDPGTIPYFDEIVTHIANEPFVQKLSDFKDPVRIGDHSRFEYSCLGTLYRRLLSFSDRSGMSFTDNEAAHIIAEALRYMIPHRPKHDEYRDGLPLLFNAAAHRISRHEAIEARHKQKQADTIASAAALSAPSVYSS